jgi:hypothetical protein
MSLSGFLDTVTYGKKKKCGLHLCRYLIVRVSKHALSSVEVNRNWIMGLL